MFENSLKRHFLFNRRVHRENAENPRYASLRGRHRELFCVENQYSAALCANPLRLSAVNHVW